MSWALGRWAVVFVVGCTRGPQVGSPTTRTCGDCHAAEARDWRRSGHAWGRDDPVYAAAVAEAFDPRWCDDCHLHDGQSVGCASCHVDEVTGEVRAVLATAEGRAAHPVREDPRLVDEGCAACHQIDVPAHQPGAPEGGPPLQDTYAEWRATGDDRSCAACHMGSAGHRMPGAHDPSFLADALRVTVGAEGDQLAVTLHASGVGHAVPTGDPFHRVEVRFGTGPDCEAPVRTVRFARLLVPDGRRMRVVTDVRVPAGGASRTVRVPAPTVRAATHWCARYVFADPRHEGALDPSAYAATLDTGRLR